METKNKETWNEKHGPHQVFVSVDINMLLDIDTLHNTFTCHFIVTQQWMMTSRDREKTKNIKEKIIPCTQWEPEWTPPDLIFPNVLDIEKDAISSHSVLFWDQMCMIKQKTRFQAVFSEDFELHSFPFDCQDLSLDILWPVSSDVCKVWPFHGQSFVDINGKRSLPEWQVHPPIAEFFYTENSPEMHPSLKLRLKVERVWVSYVYQIMLIILLISLSSFMAFMLHPLEEAGDRLAHASTMLLTSIAFQFVIYQMLPKLSYLTVIDRYSLGCNLIIVLILVEIGCISWFATHFGIEITVETDNILLGGTFALWFMFHFVLCIYVRCITIPNEKKKLKKNSSDLAGKVEKSRTQLHMDADNFHVHPDIRKKCSGLNDNNDTRKKQNKALNDDEMGMAILPDDDKKNEGNETVMSEYPRSIYYSGDRDEKFDKSGIFKSDHSDEMEYFFVHMIREKQKEKLCIRTITGNQNVPAGRNVVKCDSVPGIGKKVQGKIQLRTVKDDPNGFYWDDMYLTMTDKNTIDIDCNGAKIKYVRMPDSAQVEKRS